MRNQTQLVAPKASRRGFSNPAVAAVFKAYPTTLDRSLRFLRRMIFETALVTEGVGEIEETLRWGQPSYLTTASKSGSMIRIDRVKSTQGQYALFFHCQTTLVATFKELYPSELKYAGNRGIFFDENDAIPEEELRHCISLALTYHLVKRRNYL